MTIQRRTFIEPRDIIGLEYECTHCHSRWSIPIDRFDRKVTVCPNCNQQWLGGNASTAVASYSDDQLVSILVDRLKEVQARTFGAIIRLEVNTDLEDRQ